MVHLQIDAVTKAYPGHPLGDRDQWPVLERIADWIDVWRQVRRGEFVTLLGEQQPPVPNRLSHCRKFILRGAAARLSFDPVHGRSVKTVCAKERPWQC